jgi:serine phosphatase RsbU (regulator of sigma subunit)
MFLTLFMAILEHDTIEYCSAGAPFASLIRPDQIRSLPPTGPVISNLRGEWTSRRLTFSTHDLLVSATDGLVDHTPEDQLEADLQRVLLLQQGDPEHMLESLLTDVSRTGNAWTDDVTVILATRNS